MLDTVLFDYDGTLVNSLPLVLTTCEHVHKELSLPWDRAEQQSKIGLPLIDIAKEAAGDKVDLYMDIYQSHYAKIHDNHIQEYSKIGALLNTLHKKNITMGIVTSRRRNSLELTMGYLNWQDYFQTLITVEDTDLPKPNPDPVLKALKNLNKKPEQAIFVGDSPFDINSGKEANVLTCGVTWGMADFEKLAKENPDQIVNTRSELLQWLETKLNI